MFKKLKKFSSYSIKAIAASVFAYSSASKIASFTKNKYDDIYDLAIIGGGSGGLATAFEAANHGLKTIVIDYVQQSPAKTKWGLGGTCVNVGCIPKKLMHQSSLHGQNILNSLDYGWNNRKQLYRVFSWNKLTQNIKNHIKSINFSYIANIQSHANMVYLNAMASFIDKDTLICSSDPTIIKQYIATQQLPSSSTPHYRIKAKYFVIATGTRPQYLNISGSQFAITSDDIFYKTQPPAKTLVVGGGYVAVQIAGFLKGMGYDVSIMTRGQYLRTFDRDMVRELLAHLTKKQVHIITTSLPSQLKKTVDNKIQVTIKNQISKDISKQIYNTVLFAIGRKATTYNLNLQKIGIQVQNNGKIITNLHQVQQTNVSNIYAIGDVVSGLPQLTSTATKMGIALGKRIAHRQKGIKFNKGQMFTDLSLYPTTIFTPLQYSCCGDSQQKAQQKLGKQNIQVYHIKYFALQQQILQKYDKSGANIKDKVYAKAIVDKSSNKVIGLHYIGPNAGEIMQGFSIAMKLGLTKQSLDQAITIHPVTAQNLTNMIVTKSSGISPDRTSC